MSARLDNITTLLPTLQDGISVLYKAAHTAGVPNSLLELIHLRVSQINGCAACIYSGTVVARKNGETEERLATVVAWRETEWFTPEERAVLELSEYATRLADKSDAVPDHIWAAAAQYYNEQQLAAIVLWIATSNFFNRLNVTTAQPAGQVWG